MVDTDYHKTPSESNLYYVHCGIEISVGKT